MDSLSEGVRKFKSLIFIVEKNKVHNFYCKDFFVGPIVTQESFIYHRTILQGFLLF